MTRKCHNHTLQTNPRYHDIETQNTNSQMTLKENLSKANSCLYPSEMISNLETTLNNVQQNKNQTLTYNKTKTHH